MPTKFDYTPLIQLARDLISEYGRSVEVLRFQQTPADPDRPWAGPPDASGQPEASHVVDAVFVGMRDDELGKMVGDDELLKKSEQVLFVAAPAEVADDLTEFDQILDGDVRWQVMGGQLLKPGEQKILYMLGVKR